MTSTLVGRRERYGQSELAYIDHLTTALLVSGKKITGFWAEYLKDSGYPIPCETFKNRVQDHLRKTHQTLSGPQLERNTLSDSEVERYTQLYMLESRVMNKAVFFEHYVAVPPFDEIPSFAQFKKKLDRRLNQIKLQQHDLTDSTRTFYSNDLTDSTRTFDSEDTDCQMQAQQDDLDDKLQQHDLTDSTRSFYSDDLTDSTRTFDSEDTDCQMQAQQDDLGDIFCISDFDDKINHQLLTQHNCPSDPPGYTFNSGGANYETEEQDDSLGYLTSAFDLEDTIGPLATMQVTATSSADRVKTVYKRIRRLSGTLGGGGNGGPIYGELTVGSMQKVVDVLVQSCNFGPSSRFIDIGAGLGKPTFHVAQDPGVRLSIGIESEEIRWSLAINHLKHMMVSYNGTPNSNSINGNVFFVNNDIQQAYTLNPFTHVYMFDLGFPDWVHFSIARSFNRSMYASHLVSYKQPKTIIDSYGFEVSFMNQIKTKMHGSSQVHTAYFYCRKQVSKQQQSSRFTTSTRTTARTTAPAIEMLDITITVPPRDHEVGQYDDEVLLCDPCFFEAISVALSGVTDLESHILQLQSHILQLSENRQRKDFTRLCNSEK